MIAVVFYAAANEGQRQEYVNAAAQLRTRLADTPGIIAIDRFASVTNQRGGEKRKGPWGGPFSGAYLPIGMNRA
jgi:heme-degrading monooxygenase HmoA